MQRPSDDSGTQNQLPSGQPKNSRYRATGNAFLISGCSKPRSSASCLPSPPTSRPPAAAGWSVWAPQVRQSGVRPHGPGRRASAVRVWSGPRPPCVTHCPCKMPVCEHAYGGLVSQTRVICPACAWPMLSRRTGKHAAPAGETTGIDRWAWRRVPGQGRCRAGTGWPAQPCPGPSGRAWLQACTRSLTAAFAEGRSANEPEASRSSVNGHTVRCHRSGLPIVAREHKRVSMVVMPCSRQTAHARLDISREPGRRRPRRSCLPTRRPSASRLRTGPGPRPLSTVQHLLHGPVRVRNLSPWTLRG
jgi:hypothetical protein